MYYPMDNIENFRDLGGIRTSDGKQVKKAKLFRCAALAPASQRDLERIKELGIDTIIDFRSTREAESRKDPEIEGTEYHHISLFKEKMEGVERGGKEERFYEWMIKASFDDPDLFARQMVQNYSTLISEEQAVAGYRRFFQVRIDESNEKILWHCSIGKDRTGIAAILLLEALDADRQMIRDNYLQTNLYLGRSIEEVMEKVKEKAGKHEHYEAIRDSFVMAMSASERFIDACYRTMNEKAGSPAAYLERYFGIDAGMKKLLKEKFCE